MPGAGGRGELRLSAIKKAISPKSDCPIGICYFMPGSVLTTTLPLVRVMV